jgi:hypothetical protein
VLRSLAQSAFSNWLLRSDSIWGYPTVLTLHTFGMMVLVGAAVIIDLRVLGVAQDIPLHAMNLLFRVMWSAFAVNAVTGTMLFIASADTRGPQLIFWVKIALVFTGAATTVVIRRHFREGRDTVAITGRTKGLALVSVCVWITAITLGRLLAYVT